jgi:hypothetical protein
MQSEHSKRIFASHLRARLQKNVPQHILDNLSDDQLVEQFHRHSRLKAQVLSDRHAAAKKRISPVVQVV